ncbi:DUF4240 domain-containing protein [Micromonospora sp. NPDC049523]|uniref:DUF4240 domain-containing protein n=1 Tax=Micromonospora sp. NPDC049523 TaxID=3155921 RepID=UPI00344606D4
MRTDDFWALIDDARTGADGNSEAIIARAVALLAARDVTEIAGFDQHLWRVLAASYRADLWGAAYLINGGCSDDGFEYFRCWLILQGRATFAQAVKDPDSLAALPAVRQAAVTGEEFEAEDVLHLARNAYLKATASELPAQEHAAYPELDEFWDFDDEASARQQLPRLAALFVEPPAE